MIFSRVVGAGLAENLALGQRLGGMLGRAGWQPCGRAFQAERVSGTEREELGGQ